MFSELTLLPTRHVHFTIQCEAECACKMTRVREHQSAIDNRLEFYELLCSRPKCTWHALSGWLSQFRTGLETYADSDYNQITGFQHANMVATVFLAKYYNDYVMDITTAAGYNVWRHQSFLSYNCVAGFRHQLHRIHNKTQWHLQYFVAIVTNTSRHTSFRRGCLLYGTLYGKRMWSYSCSVTCCLQAKRQALASMVPWKAEQ